MAKPKRTPREEIERAFHVSFKLPEQAAELLDNYRDQILTEAAELQIAAQAKAEAAELERFGHLDHETLIQHDAVHQAASLLLNARTQEG
jgi:hypothetical protein